MTQVSIAFERQARRLPISSILPMRTIPDITRQSTKYRRIATSIRELGVIEPLVVHHQDRGTGTKDQYVLLDGHLRLDVLKESGATDVLCLLSIDDEGFTYNHKVNQIAPIQEHFMIRKVLDSGVSEERIATALGIDASAIRKKRDLLDGICPEAVELLKDRRVSPGALREFRRVLPMRQIEMAELMRASANLSTPYAKCLVAATPREQFVESELPKDVDGLTHKDIARIEREMQTIEADFRRIQDGHGRNMLNLVLAVGYVRRLFENAAVVKFLAREYGELMTELEQIAETTDLSETSVEEPESAPSSDAR